eukprot:274418_1
MMEEVIKFRLSVNQLKKEEFNEFINKLDIKTITSIMLKGFLYMHEYSENEYNESTNYIKNINNIISTIITSRKINESTEVRDTNISPNPLKINKLPNAMIQTCASYLNAVDYFDFSICDASIYVACNSPISLEKLDMTEDGYPNNLSRFRLLKQICISPFDFTTKYDENIYQLRHIKSLTLNMNENIDYDGMEILINKNYIDLANIEELKCISFGSDEQLYECNTFCKFLQKFPNVTHFYIEDLHLTNINDNINEIESLLPKLTALTFTSNNKNAELFRNKMIETHSKQIVYLEYDEEDTDLNMHSINLFQLKELIIHSPNIDSLKEFIQGNGKLQRVLINLGSTGAHNNEKIKSIIVYLYSKYYKINQIKLRLNINQFEKIIEWTEIGLRDLKFANVSRVHNYLRIIYEVYVNYEDETKLLMYEIGLYLNRIINASIVSPIKHFLIKFTLYGNIKETKLELMNKLRNQYLTFEERGINCDDEKYHTIIVCNKQCIINGYWETWMV